MPYPVSVAPMMDRTDRHYRYFMRQITRRTLLYTEMVTTGAIIHGDRDRLLGFSPEEKPLALQLGGDSPKALADCSRIAYDMGYDEVNLNVGCPSDRVQNGHFGACLMAQPERVAACVAAMKAAVPIPVTVKHRIGIDNRDRYEDMAHFVEMVAAAGCRHFTVHARKAWLQGLNPKQNRTVPPLRYDDVYRLKRGFPQLTIEINGGITQLEQIGAHLAQVDAVMVGRAAYDDPYLFAAVDGVFFGGGSQLRGSEDGPKGPSRREVAEAMLPYIDYWIARWDGRFKLNKITRHMLQLFTGQPGSRAWKRHLTEQSCRGGAGSEVVRQALELVPSA
ncbi:MAG: tRNA dihydrouridine(20/20a) synthase DusA [Elainellaceae cyanobacterium]